MKPDLVLVDIGLPGRSGLELIKDIRAVRPETAVLVISMHGENLYAERVLRAGGRGYIMKQEATGKVLTAIRTVLQGELYVSEKIKEKIVRHQVGGQAGKVRSPVDQPDKTFGVFRSEQLVYPAPS